MKKKGKSVVADAKKPDSTATKASVRKKAPGKKPVAIPGNKAAAKAAPTESQKVRVKLVRDSFTMPREDFDRITRLKARAIDFKRPAKKSELLRAGLQALEKLDGPALLAALNALTPIKTGRPKKHR